MCAHSEDKSGIASSRQYVELVQPMRPLGEEGDSIQYVNSHASKPTDPEDQKWYSTLESGIDSICH